jgi:hypothetical protein
MEAQSPISVIHPLTFGLRNPLYASALDHLHKMNPGHTVDTLDPQTPMLISHCLCGETEMIYLLSQYILDEDVTRYKYVCASCNTSTEEWAMSKGHAKQLWDNLQTK